MSTTEIKKQIANTSEEIQEWFENVQINVSYNFEETYKEINGFIPILQFFSKQAKGWQELTRVPNDLEDSSRHFINNSNSIKDFFERYKNNMHANNLENQWRGIQQQISRSDVFTFDSYQTEIITHLNEINQEQARGAFNYFCNRSFQQNKHHFIGAMVAYEKEYSDKTAIPSRRKSERKALSKLKGEYEEHTSRLENDTSTFFNQSQEKFKNYVGKIDEFKSEKEEAFNSWFEGVESDNEEERIIGAKNKIEELENLYEEQLRLKKPAEYWATRATKLHKDGQTALKYIVGLVIFSCITLYLLLWLTPEGMLLSFLKGNAQAIKWSVIYVTFISFLGYGINLVSKYMMSSFHLARDAEEREQLTYLYLALIKDDALEETDRNLVLQSLFSRSESGLLKSSDSNVKMPNDLLKILSKGKV
ncbi:DUF6161 domain-containing protein [Flammeovirga sp. OC4]|uniref:DUF6161 domain-containing protein n=1 Tax=Flammeovirga sp. OC4 TaxID=1382345 RepID=UPI0005C6B579|nr:DUF6161 domain-containing protein [Flammeovirga sp. OC4]